MTEADLLPTMRRALGRNYRIEREVGRGGMGVVFLATDLALDRRVAIKVIHPELVVNRALVSRFLAEARLIARIRHPHIVSVHSAGEAEGHLYFVMDFLEGETLRQRLLRERRLPVDLAVSIASQLAEAVDAAAAAGVVHRDLKPENVFLEGPPDAPRALLTDFGIARTQGVIDGPTGPNAVMGTPAYMSPEQATGEGIDSRSDLYALGVVTHEMLAGEPPFTGPPRVVISRQIVDPAPSLAAVRPDCPAAVTAAVLRALEKIPDARWQGGAPFRRALRGEPTPVTSAPGRRPRRRWRAVAAVATAALLAIAGLGWSVLQQGGDPGNPRLSLLVLPFDNLREEPELGWLREGSVSMLALALSQWQDLGVVDQERVHDLLSQEKVPDDEPIGLTLARRLARRAGAGTVVLGDFTRTGDSLRLTARTYDVATGSRLDLVETAGSGREDVRPLFDRLAARLLDLSGAPEGDRPSLANVTTGSLEAYRAYLQGIEHLNHWELMPAATALRRAVSLDSTFSLAYYRLGLTRGWVMGAGDTVGRNAVLQAARFAGRLPERERSMIEAYRAMLDGDTPRSQQLYRTLLARDSADADAWYGLADAYFHDAATGSTAAGMTRSLQAFRRTLELDPQYALAYEHIMALLTGAASREASYALVRDSFVATTAKDGRPLLDSATRESAVRGARIDAVRTARTWVALQPAVARAHHALFEAYFASEDYGNASQEVAELRKLLPESGKDLAGYLEARVRFARGDTRLAAELVRATTAGLTRRAPELPDFGREFVSDVLAGANPLAYEGDIDGAAEVIALGDAIRRATALSDATPTIWEQDKVWEWSRLAQLYSAAGGPARDLHRVWGSLAAQARRGLKTEQADIAGAGAAAAVGLLLTPDPDPRPVAELEALTGKPSAPGVRALAALARGDSAEARRVLSDSTGPLTEPMGSVYLGFAANDPRPLEAEARFQLGDYREAIRLLQSFDEARLWRRGFDSRWGLLGRIHLLRGLAYERLGETGPATREFQRVVTTWRSADEPLLPFVQQAQAGLARLRGVVEGRSDEAASREQEYFSGAGRTR